LPTKLHSDGTYAEKLAFINPGCHGGYHFKKLGEEADFGYPPADTYGEIFPDPENDAGRPVLPQHGGTVCIQNGCSEISGGDFTRRWIRRVYRPRT
jgi:hypothetical protein